MFNQIPTFIEVVHHGSFIGAAKSLHLSNAAISKQIQKLEEELGVLLIERTPRHVKLTDAGQIFYEHCTNLQEHMRDIQSIVSGFKDEPTGTLRILGSIDYGEENIIPRLTELADIYPKLEIQFELADRIPDFANENIDIILGFSFQAPDDWKQRVLMKSEVVTCASPEYLKKQGEPKKPQELMNHKVLLHLNRDKAFNFNQELTVKPKNTIRLNDSRSLRQLAIDGYGIVQMHDYAVARQIANGKLIRILKRYTEAERTVYCFYKYQTMIQPKVRVFLNWLNLG